MLAFYDFGRNIFPLFNYSFAHGFACSDEGVHRGKSFPDLHANVAQNQCLIQDHVAHEIPTKHPRVLVRTPDVVGK
jgi:hypothetical protein